MNHLEENTFPHLRPLLGKRVEAIVNGEKRVGILSFAGINELHGEFQVTLSRCPLWPVKKGSVKEYKG